MPNPYLGWALAEGLIYALYEILLDTVLFDVRDNLLVQLGSLLVGYL